MSYLDPPPNNAGIRADHTAPKKKTLEFENFTFSYDYDTREFKASSVGTEITFNEVELVELRAAMATFGIGLGGNGNQVNYR